MNRNKNAILSELKQQHQQLRQMLEQENLSEEQRSRVWKDLSRVAHLIAANIDPEKNSELKQMAAQTIRENLNRIEHRTNNKILDIERRLKLLGEAVEDD